MGRRAARPDFDRWAAQAQGCGHCYRPIRLRGSSTTRTNGGHLVETYDSRAEPDGVAYLRCGNRRAAVCPSCSHEYQGDMWHLLYAGTAGGIKDVPDTIATHPLALRHPDGAVVRPGAHHPRPGPRLPPPPGPPAHLLRARPARALPPCAPRRRPRSRRPAVLGLLRLRRTGRVQLARPRTVAPVHHHPSPPAGRPPRHPPHPAEGLGHRLVREGGRVPTPRSRPLPRPRPRRRARRQLPTARSPGHRRAADPRDPDRGG